LTEILYLGHKISAQEVSVDEEKIKATMDWPRPKTISHLRGFLGLYSFYRRFIKGFSQPSTLLIDLTKKGAFSWSALVQRDFNKIEEVMSSCPILPIPNFSLPFVFECDASGEGIGVVLMQNKHLITFESLKCKESERSFSIYEKEMLAIMYALANFKQYFVCGRLVVKTNHNSLKFFLNLKDLNDRQQNWLSKLQAYEFDIEYTKGNNNVVDDALSRNPYLCLLTNISTYY